MSRAYNTWKRSEFDWKARWERPLGRPWCKQKDNIKLELTQIR
jgi:hypothetical protein